MKKYGLILADPPWRFETFSDKGLEKSPQAHYQCETVEDIAKIPVPEWAADDCVMFMWATFPMLPEALWLLKEWGFQYKTGGAWRKLTKHGKTGFGTGYWLRSSCEPFIIGTKGKPPVISHDISNLIEDFMREHSRKPDCQYEFCEGLNRGPYLEMFARQSWPNWDTFGNETEKFPVGSSQLTESPLAFQMDLGFTDEQVENNKGESNG